MIFKFLHPQRGPFQTFFRVDRNHSVGMNESRILLQLGQRKRVKLQGDGGISTLAAGKVAGQRQRIG